MGVSWGLGCGGAGLCFGEGGRPFGRGRVLSLGNFFSSLFPQALRRGAFFGGASGEGSLVPPANAATEAVRGRPLERSRASLRGGALGGFLRATVLSGFFVPHPSLSLRPYDPAPPPPLRLPFPRRSEGCKEESLSGRFPQGLQTQGGEGVRIPSASMNSSRAAPSGARQHCLQAQRVFAALHGLQLAKDTVGGIRRSVAGERPWAAERGEEEPATACGRIRTFSLRSGTPASSPSGLSLSAALQPIGGGSPVRTSTPVPIPLRARHRLRAWIRPVRSFATREALPRAHGQARPYGRPKPRRHPWSRRKLSGHPFSRRTPPRRFPRPSSRPEGVAPSAASSPFPSSTTDPSGRLASLACTENSEEPKKAGSRGRDPA